MTRRLLLLALLVIERLQCQLGELSERVAELADRGETAFVCLDCGTDTLELGEYYLVWPDVWARAGVGADDGMLCVSCLERRLGRLLSMHDFTAAPVNFKYGGARVRERLFR